MDQNHQKPNIIIDALNANEDGDSNLFKLIYKNRFCFDKASRIWYEFKEHWQEDRLEEAIAAITEVVKIYQAQLKSEEYWIENAHRQGKTETAASHYRAVLSRQSKNIEALNNLAWILCSGTNRDPIRAVTLAKRACELTNWQQPELMDTLIAAHIAAGQNENARNIAERALITAEKLDRTDLVESLKQRLERLSVDNRSDL